jgi:hypothetical protein
MDAIGQQSRDEGMQGIHPGVFLGRCELPNLCPDNKHSPNRHFFLSCSLSSLPIHAVQNTSTKPVGRFLL